MYVGPWPTGFIHGEAKNRVAAYTRWGTLVAKGEETIDHPLLVRGHHAHFGRVARDVAPVGASWMFFSGGGATVLLTVDTERPTAAHVDTIKGDATTGLAQHGYGEPVDGRATTPFGPILERRWNTPTGIHVRLLVIPICDREASSALTLSWRDGGDTSGQMLETWLASLAPAQIEASPFCQAVKVERTTDLP